MKIAGGFGPVFSLGIVGLICLGALYAAWPEGHSVPSAPKPLQAAKAAGSATNDSSEAPPDKRQVGERLSTLIPLCQAESGADCSQDIYQKVWLRLEADNGEVTKVDIKSIQHFNTGAASVAIYTYVPNTRFDPSRLRRLFFDCAGHFRDDTSGPSPEMDAAPRSIAGGVAAIACAGARDTRLRDADRDSGAGEKPAEYCSGFSADACDRIQVVIKSGTKPAYCRPGFAVLGSPENRGLSPEQIRICFLMAGDFTKLSTK